MGFSAFYRTQEAKNSPRARFSGYDSNSSGGLSSRFRGPQSTPIEPAADQTLVELLFHAPVEPVGAVCGPPGPDESSHGPPPGQICTNQPDKPRRSSCCDCPPSTAIDAAAAETSPTELPRAPAKPVDTVGGPLGTLGAPHGPLHGKNR